jgi:hypothetical protein
LRTREIEAVARSIVRQLKARSGPYGLNLAAFLNDGVLARAVEEAGVKCRPAAVGHLAAGMDDSG